MRPTGGKNYGSIPHLSSSKLGEGDHYATPGQERILTEKKRDNHDNILVFEKYCGSNVGIAKVNGKIHALTRKGYEAKTSPFIQHHLFATWVEARDDMFIDMLNEGERICAEWLAQAHGLRYRIENEPIVYFDYFTPDNKRVLHEELGGIAIKYGLQLPRELHEGGAIAVEQLIPELFKGDASIYPEHDLPEGLVYRVERNGKVDFLAKWVRQDFPTGKYLNDDGIIWNMPIQTFVNYYLNRPSWKTN